MREESSIIIKNGFVVDPLSGYNLEKMDLIIQKGVFVERLNGPEPTVIDARNMVIMPGGVDIHTHFAGSKVNLGRMLRPEEHNLRSQFDHAGNLIGSGWATPTTKLCGHQYTRMGYTLLVEPAIAPIKAGHTHEEMNDVPFVDKLGLLLLGNSWIVMDLIAQNKLDLLKEYVLWGLWAAKSYGIKIVAAGSGEAWAWGKSIKSIDEEVPSFSLTPKEIIYNLAKINEAASLPTTIHIHTNNLGSPGNYKTTLDTLEVTRNIPAAEGRKYTIHLVHAQFSSYEGDSWKTFSSGSEYIADYINKNQHVSFDLGQVVFSNTTTMTADGAWQYNLHRLTGNKWVNVDVENETASGIVPYIFHRKNYVNAIQWAIGLELALLVEDAWKIALSTDHPNGGAFTSYPLIIAWLMNKRFREAMIDKINKKAVSQIILPSINREYSLFEIAIITRSSPSRILGMEAPSSIKVGNPANIAIYDLGLGEPGKQIKPSEIIKCFSQAKYTIREGRVVMRDGVTLNETYGCTYYIGSGDESLQLADLTNHYFDEYYTVKKDSYTVKDYRILNPRKISWRP